MRSTKGANSNTPKIRESPRAELDDLAGVVFNGNAPVIGHADRAVGVGDRMAAVVLEHLTGTRQCVAQVVRGPRSAAYEVAGLLGDTAPGPEAEDLAADVDAALVAARLERGPRAALGAGDDVAVVPLEDVDVGLADLGLVMPLQRLVDPGPQILPPLGVLLSLEHFKEGEVRFVVVGAVVGHVVDLIPDGEPDGIW